MNHKNKKSSQKFHAVLTAGVLCLAVLSFQGCAFEDSSAPPEKNSDTADTSESSTASNKSYDAIKPIITSVGEFTAQDINGETYTQEIFQDYELTMVNVFATWCSPCVAEIPDLEELHHSVEADGVNVIGIVLDAVDETGELSQEGIEKAQLLAEQTGASYPFLVPDSTYMNGRLFGIEAIPETFFVDKDGKIVGDTYTGSRSLNDWLSVVQLELEQLEEDS